MHFLCPRHRQLLRVQPQSKLMDLWQEWMNQAALCRAMDEDSRCVSFSGCAFELMCELLPQQRLHRKTVITKLTLAAIYAGRALAALGETAKASMILSLAFQRLGMTLGDAQLADWSRQCMMALMDGSRQEAFFSRYLNLPLDSAPVSPTLQYCH